MRKVRRKKSKAIKSIISLILLILLIVGAYFGYNYYKNSKDTGIPIVNEFIKSKEEINFEDKDEKIDTTQYVNTLPEKRTEYNNTDIMGRIEIPGLNIDSLVMRTVNNQYYLNYNINRQWDEIGVPFFDYRNKNLAIDSQINIYGHNTERQDLFDKLPFTNLEAYTDKNIFNNYKDVYVSIDEKQMHYEVIGIKVITDNNPEHMKVIFKSNDDFLNHMNKVMTGLLHKREGVEITAKDRILIIQICHFNPKDSYLLVICKEV